MTSCRPDWPIGAAKDESSLRRAGFRQFFDLDVAQIKINPAQVSLIDELERLVSAGI